MCRLIFIMYISIYLSIYLSIYIYIYREREREREFFLIKSYHPYIHIFILIIIIYPILAIVHLCKAPESNTIDLGAIQINCIIIIK